MPTCPIHQMTELRCPACDGARGGGKNTERQVAARNVNVQKARFAPGKGWPKGKPRGPRPPRAPNLAPPVDYGKPPARHEYGEGKRWPT